MSFFDRWIINLKKNKIKVDYVAVLHNDKSNLLDMTLSATLNTTTITVQRSCSSVNLCATRDLLMGELLKHVQTPLPYTE